MDMPMTPAASAGTSGRAASPRPRTVTARATPLRQGSGGKRPRRPRRRPRRRPPRRRSPPIDPTHHRGTGRRRARRGRDAAEQRRGARPRQDGEADSGHRKACSLRAAAAQRRRMPPPRKPRSARRPCRGPATDTRDVGGTRAVERGTRERAGSAARRCAATGCVRTRRGRRTRRQRTASRPPIPLRRSASRTGRPAIRHFRPECASGRQCAATPDPAVEIRRT